MTVTEACHVNTILRFFLDLPAGGERKPEAKAALLASVELADRASKVLSAGLDGLAVAKEFRRTRAMRDAVEQFWPAVQELVDGDAQRRKAYEAAHGKTRRKRAEAAARREARAKKGGA